ncbi:spore germination protein [Bacillus ndiopicus]|uniref:spore germination protein n=1 Tax=Bacillus ndiopicus TaxID=1347368 RepID=UPI0038994F50
MQGFLAFLIPYIIFNVFNQLKSEKKKESQKETNPNSSQAPSEHYTGDYTLDYERIKQQIGHNWDVHFREFLLGDTGVRVAIIFLDGLSDKELIEKHIMMALMQNFTDEKYDESSFKNGEVLQEFIKNRILPISDLKEEQDIKLSATAVLTGSAALIIDGISNALILDIAKGKSRNIEEPVSEALVRGPRVGFTEILSDNTALLRKHGENSNLFIINFKVGQRSKKELIVAYIEDVADPNLVEEVKRRIQKITIDDVAESGYIEQLIEDNYLSPFPQVQSTERPDRVFAALMEGRVAILLDGTPFALVAPVTLGMLLQSPEDYYERWLPSSLIRLLRYLAASVTLFAPSLYIAFVSFHQGLIPTKLALSIMRAREGVPFPALIEALIMEVAIEILREAGLRLPKPIGPTMGIVGGLVIGEAAVQAGIVSPVLVIIVALTAISSFVIPQYNAGITLRMLRFIAMFLAALFGLYGVVIFFLFLCSHLVKLKSFGVPYLSPTVPYRAGDWKDFMVRMPLKMMKNRPRLLHTKDSTRRKD